MNQVLNELIKNSSRSDHKLAKAIGVSQPTVTRLRNQLEKEGYIQEYTVIPDLTKINYSIMAIILLKYKVNGHRTKEMTEDIGNGNSLFASRAQGMGKNAVLISLFKATHSRSIVPDYIYWNLFTGFWIEKLCFDCGLSYFYIGVIGFYMAFSMAPVKS